MSHPFARVLADIFLPASCLSCGGDVSPAGTPLVCRACASNINWRSGLQPLLGSPLRALYAAGEYDGPLRDLLKALKYGGKQTLAAPLAREWMSRTPYQAAAFDAVVPVPMAAWKSWRRGYNQAYLLAREVARRWGKPLMSAGLSRRWFARSQTKLGRKPRFENANQGFKIGTALSACRGKTILLFDDVCTTGATLNACARLLMRAGAKAVSAGTIAQEDLA